MKERIRYSWITKEVFSCIKCGASGDDIGWNDYREKNYNDSVSNEVLYCRNCLHELTEREELEELVPFIEFLEYRFFLRFAKSDFEICPKCQEAMDRLFNDAMFLKFASGRTVELVRVNGFKVEQDGNRTIIDTHKKIDKMTYYFTLPFLYRNTGNDVMTFLPCEKCQEKLAKILDRANWILGNKDYDKPPIELKRIWRDHYEKQTVLERNGLIRFNDKDNFGKCQQCGKLDYLELLEGQWMCDKCQQKRAEDALIDIAITKQKEMSI